VPDAGVGIRNILAGVAAFAFASAPAAIERIEITSRSVVLEGREFGAAGSYEKIAGRAYFKVKPDDAHNRIIVDLDKAPVGTDGTVEFSADIFVLRPTQPSKGNGTLLLEVPNRGNKNILSLVNYGTPSSDPAKASDFGDGCLLRRGYTLAWIGWQWDLPATPGAMRLYAPVAREADGKSIRGVLRDDFTVTERREDFPLGHFIVGLIGGREYQVADANDPKNTLTVRDAPVAARRNIPRTDWSFESEGLRYRAGFEPGKIYELIYGVQDPVVSGLGLAAVRDFVAHLKRDRNEVATVARAYAFGASQTGRFLRHFLYQNFNADEHDRPVLDGVIAHVAGAGRGSFNHRFAQPSRSAGSMDAFFFPVDMFPFTDLPTREPVSGETAGMLDAVRAAGVAPKIFYTNTSYEYWSRAASLIHTTPDGKADVAPPPDTRIYSFAGLQHFSRPFPPAPGTGEMKGRNLTNPNPIRFALRAMIAAMDAWVRDGIEPPPSQYPRIGDGTLVPLSRVAWPKIPGVAFPTTFHRAWRLDFGPEWKRGVITAHPPRLGTEFTGLVPQVNADGNEIAGVQLPELMVPLATGTGWNLRDPTIGFPDQLASFVGSYLPFPWTSEVQRQSGDPRLAIETRYTGEDDFLRRFEGAAKKAVSDRWMLAEDLPVALREAKKEWQSVKRLAGVN
jgi:hypothetical protein